jgi:hypothetical protein
VRDVLTNRKIFSDSANIGTLNNVPNLSKLNPGTPVFKIGQMRIQFGLKR